ncbi:uncharacterized protein MELLADRAFT_112903 [Melampsora larici-populina 98AG31]|uniref:Uncharacterized protein n=1 Tax=Melampsora larici-populina (strain 98AG31 / pathotype 3-4-7) TaxID=747676 RepID=F4S822_MELLP|nr:uncharacterized protein MELLADRAFT_112903 [Melampsora larici-populina 98AG31]EGF99230.1 hypothetical protein MELLADRAFT_112903 [Melampsora larici-populina 98AG31]
MRLSEIDVKVILSAGGLRYWILFLNFGFLGDRHPHFNWGRSSVADGSGNQDLNTSNSAFGGHKDEMKHEIKTREPLYEPLLNTPYKRLPQADPNDPETFLLEESFTDFQLAKQKANTQNGKSIVKTGFTPIFSTQTQTPDSRHGTGWEVWYEISQKAKSSASPEVKEMAEAIAAYGTQFDIHGILPQDQTKHITSTINLFYMFLQSDSLNTAERIWSVGVLSHLKSQIPELREFAIPRSWTAKDLGRLRGQYLEYFLQDKDLETVAQKMWSESPPKLETTNPVIQEAIRRESIVHLIKEQMAKAPLKPSPEFGALYLAFINLETPMDSKKASSLMKLLFDHLEKTTGPWNLFDEEDNTTRMILHLEEYNVESYLQFKELARTNRFREKILEGDTSFQLAEEGLSPSFRFLLEDFRKTKTANEHQIPKIFDILKDEHMSVSRLGRFFRVLNLVFMGNGGMYNAFKLQLERYSNPEVISEVSRTLSLQAESLKHNPDTDGILVDYIIHLLSSRYDDGKMFRKLHNLHGARGSLESEEARRLVKAFVHGGTWDKQGHWMSSGQLRKPLHLLCGREEVTTEGKGEVRKRLWNHRMRM